jgi:hypothetical protein
MPIEQHCLHQVGFIFKGDCGQPADAFCNNCAKPICRKHCRVNHAMICCGKCSKDIYDLDLDDSPSPDINHSHNNPYFYHQHSDSSRSSDSTHSSHGSGSEFTDSDRANFATESQSDGGGSFEQDFSGS